MWRKVFSPDNVFLTTGLSSLLLAMSPLKEDNLKHWLFHKLGCQPSILTTYISSDLQNKTTWQCVICGCYDDKNRPHYDFRQNQHEMKRRLEQKIWLQHWHNPFTFSHVKNNSVFQSKVIAELKKEYVSEEEWWRHHALLKRVK